MRTRAAVLDEIGKSLRVDELRIDPPKEREVAIRVVASGICHSDYSVAHGVLRSPFPIVLGHEAAGIVEAVGPGVVDLVPGDHVVASLTPACGECEFCLDGIPVLCVQMNATLVNGTMVDGTTRLHRGGEAVHQLCGIASFAERAVLAAGAAIKVPNDVPLETVCLVGCAVTTGVGAVLRSAEVKAGSSVAVIGCGGVGLSIVQGARIAGATTIVAIDSMEEKQTLATSLGATHAVDPGAEDPVKAVRKLTGGGVHYAFEAIGRTDTIEQAWAMLRPAGMAVVVGVPKSSEVVGLRASGFLQGKRMIGSIYGHAIPSRDIPHYVDLYRKGDLKLDPMITRRIRLEEVNDALAAMGRGEGARSVIVFD
jgi:S-(hydroxymethyl)glutathione dehydrogenase/alcohol dehydrogenase